MRLITSPAKTCRSLVDGNTPRSSRLEAGSAKEDIPRSSRPEAGSATKNRLLFAQSLDGYIAGHDGSLHWLAPWQDVDLGIDAFLDEISTIVLGRKTFEQIQGFGNWPYEEQRTLILTSKFFDGLPNGCSIDPGHLTKCLGRAKALASKDIWIMGGAQVMAQALEANLVERMEVFVIPVVLGGGIPALPTGDSHSFTTLESKILDRGVVKLTYDLRGKT